MAPEDNPQDGVTISASDLAMMKAKIVSQQQRIQALRERLSKARGDLIDNMISWGFFIQSEIDRAFTEDDMMKSEEP